MSAVAALGSASTSRVVLPFGAFVRHKLASCHAGLQDAFMKYPEILPVMLMAVAGLAAAGPSPRLTRQRKENYNALQELPPVTWGKISAARKSLPAAALWHLE
eukprot:gnl/Hemi2/24359_TR8184_c0_g1_i1.p4 gnl/Hemi2/24359_TR8184_c0_g1~~gnl/Hemi2/24359_TR8184_c0_g1_i1.p4  ORF type:complete len:103 (+),score=26.30 gnl/Hemi2/24359_TR8184_c0_g1_i1:60-368(+)